MIVALFALLGLAVGSFLNVVIHRVPRDESVVDPPSHCPGCGHAVRWFDNVPVVSWLVLRGRCRDCGTRISPRYVLVEAVTGILFGLICWATIDGSFASIVLALVWSLGAALAVCLSLIDIAVRRLPRSIVKPATTATVLGLALVAQLTGAGDQLVRAVLAGAALYAAFLILELIYPAGMGHGDTMLVGLLGLYLGWLGWPQVIIGIFAGFLCGGVYSLVLVVVGRAGRKSMIPFGPFLILGTTIGMIWGERLGTAYLSLIV